jgi:hypothetical protein
MSAGRGRKEAGGTHADTDGVSNLDNLRVEVLLLNLDIRVPTRREDRVKGEKRRKPVRTNSRKMGRGKARNVLEGATDETLEGTDSVAEVGSLLSLRRLTDHTALGAERNEGTAQRRRLVSAAASRSERERRKTNGVARLETSLTRMSIPRLRAAPICQRKECQHSPRACSSTTKLHLAVLPARESVERKGKSPWSRRDRCLPEQSKRVSARCSAGEGGRVRTETNYGSHCERERGKVLGG